MGRITSAVGAVRRSGQVYDELIARRETLRCGHVYSNEQFPDLPSCNFVSEVVLADDGDPVSEVEQYFAGAGLRCWRWTPAENQRVETLQQVLAPAGYLPEEGLCVVYSHGSEVARSAGVRVLGARAMRRAYTEIVKARSLEIQGPVDQLNAAQLERLNEPAYDAFVGLVADNPVGIVSLLQAGEIGRVCDLFVHPDWRGRGVASSLLSYVLLAARRWALRPVCAEIHRGNAPARGLMRKLGFVESGTHISFVLPGAVREWA
jgi:GNAT superfamily N-acetyltransferase